MTSCLKLMISCLNLMTSCLKIKTSCLKLMTSCLKLMTSCLNGPVLFARHCGRKEFSVSLIKHCHLLVSCIILFLLMVNANGGRAHRWCITEWGAVLTCFRRLEAVANTNERSQSDVTDLRASLVTMTQRLATSPCTDTGQTSLRTSVVRVVFMTNKDLAVEVDERLVLRKVEDFDPERGGVSGGWVENYCAVKGATDRQKKTQELSLGWAE